MSSNGLRFVSAASVSLEEYAALFTASFGGYRYAITFDAERLARRVRQEHHDLRHSLVAYAGAKPVGVAALAVRGDAGWVGGFGVVPEERGRGRGRELMSALLERARACGLRRLSLEVLASNTAARALYERAGMRVARDLLILERPAATTQDAAADGTTAEEARAAPRSPNDGPTSLLTDAAPAELLGHFARLHTEPPAWQRDLASLLVKSRLRGLRLGDDAARTEAYALVSHEADGSTYLVDLAAAGDAAAARICDAVTRLPGTLKIVNEPEHGPFVRPLLARGFVEADRQHEMRLDL